MTKVKDLHRQWAKDPAYKAEYDALDEEFQIARTLIEARKRAGLSQTELAARMKTSQSYVARIESGQVQPSTTILHRFALSTGSRLKITMEPAAKSIESDTAVAKSGNRRARTA
jgi:transcriptional regulator with XRE-family HTH domain